MKGHCKESAAFNYSCIQFVRIIDSDNMWLQKEILISITCYCLLEFIDNIKISIKPTSWLNRCNYTPKF